MRVDFEQRLVNVRVNNEYLRRGSGEGCREVFFGHDVVLKFNDDHHKSQNEREARNLMALAKTEDADHFPTLMDYAKDFDWIVVSRFRPLQKNGLTSAHDKECKRLMKKYGLRKDIAIEFGGEGTGRGWNCGVSRGKFVIYDLGIEKVKIK